MRAARPATHSQLSWARPCGTRPCPMMETTSSWNTWTWKSSCRKTASQPTQLRPTRPRRRRSHRRLLCSRPRHPRRPHPLWWTSAAAPPHRFTQPWHLRPASTAPAQQVGSTCSRAWCAHKSTPARTDTCTLLNTFSVSGGRCCYTHTPPLTWDAERKHAPVVRPLNTSACIAALDLHL